MGKIIAANLTRPELLTAEHDLSMFDCGHETLNDWLQKRALKNQGLDASNSYVICDQMRVVAFYAIATGSIERSKLPGGLARNMPDPIPVMVLGRLAIDRTYQGQKLGAGLLKDAMLRTLKVSQIVGVKALLVHAISEEARRFYRHFGFQESPIDPMTLMLSVKMIRHHYGE
ncbi:GNAT family N-acetyltransferase [Paremcibacter congregatus]|uniref:GNAT family N-acetyltransferase n=1 Tax=Paremcibacter congregatus TaxID=2043170 RepID=UPI0030ECF5E6